MGEDSTDKPSESHAAPAIVCGEPLGRIATADDVDDQNKPDLKRLGSSEFRSGPDRGLSVQRSKLTFQEEWEWVETHLGKGTGKTIVGAFMITAEAVAKIVESDQAILSTRPDPLPGNIAHALIFPLEKINNKNRAQRVRDEIRKALGQLVEIEAAFPNRDKAP